MDTIEKVCEVVDAVWRDCVLQVHIRLWRADTLQTLHILGENLLKSSVSCLAFTCLQEVGDYLRFPHTYNYRTIFKSWMLYLTADSVCLKLAVLLFRIYQKRSKQPFLMSRYDWKVENKRRIDLFFKDLFELHMSLWVTTLPSRLL